MYGGVLKVSVVASSWEACVSKAQTDNKWRGLSAPGRRAGLFNTLPLPADLDPLWLRMGLS